MTDQVAESFEILFVCLCVCVVELQIPWREREGDFHVSEWKAKKKNHETLK